MCLQNNDESNVQSTQDREPRATTPRRHGSSLEWYLYCRRMAIPMPSSPPSHYEVLGLPYSSRVQLATRDIKTAYRRTLLQHHPDKLDKLDLPQTNHLRSTISTAKYTIDDISLAYKVLSDPRARAEYDRELRVRQPGPQHKFADVNAQTGLEICDLDDLDCDEGQNVWYLGCRCGEGRGFTVTEEELDREKEHGEVVTGCRGCSLWLKVLFQTA